MPNEPTPLLIAINILAIFVLCVITRPGLTKGVLSRLARTTSLVLILVFCLFSFWGRDWFGYLSYFNDIKAGQSLSAVEEVYLWLFNVCPNYLSFRLCVWGVAVVLLTRILTRLETNFDTALFFFCSIYLIWFSYARVTLCMALLFYGMSLFASNSENKSKKAHYLLGALCVFLSFYLHKSSFFGIIVVLLVLFLGPLKKKAVAIAIIAFPIVVMIVAHYLSGALEGLMENDAETINEYVTAGTRYLERDRYVYGPGIVVQRWFERLPYYLISFACIKAQFNHSAMIPKGVNLFMLATIFITLGSTVFLFNLGFNTDIIYTRFLRYAIIPGLVSLTYLYQKKLYPRFTGFILFFAILGCFYALTYSLYNVIVG